MLFNWYLIFNLEELPEEILSRTYRPNLAGFGIVDILVSRGELLTIYFEGVLLPIGFEGKNPFIGLGQQYAVYQDEEGNVYFGVRIQE